MPAVTSPRISWYRSPVERELVAELNRRSDAKGLAQALGHLGLLAITGGVAIYAAGRLPVPLLLGVLFVHGTFWAFLLNGFHELCHKSVFRTRWLNTLFLGIVSFLSWYNPVHFWASHQEHHKWTLHPPSDLEAVLPVKLTYAMFIKSAVINPWDFLTRLKDFLRHALGRVEGEWESVLFPPEDVEARGSLFRWARIHLIGQAAIVVASLAMGWWIVPIILTLAPFYGGALQWLCNNTQHSGLMDNTPDYRLCCRTILLNPFVRYLYWQMNYHTEHHMFAAVPCYNLGRLHEAIKDDLPYCPDGLVAAWKQIIPIMERQRDDPTYEYVARLPARAGETRV